MSKPWLSDTNNPKRDFVTCLCLYTHILRIQKHLCLSMDAYCNHFVNQSDPARVILEARRCIDTVNLIHFNVNCFFVKGEIRAGLSPYYKSIPKAKQLILCSKLEEIVQERMEGTVLHAMDLLLEAYHNLLLNPQKRISFVNAFKRYLQKLKAIQFPSIPQVLAELKLTPRTA